MSKRVEYSIQRNKVKKSQVEVKKQSIRNKDRLYSTKRPKHKE